jgi:phage gpG-like protein
MISVEFDNSRLQKELAKIPAKFTSNLFLEGVADIAVDGISGKGGVFDNEGIVAANGAESVLWEQSRAANVRRAKGKTNSKTLHQRGRLRRSIHRTDAKNAEVIVGSNVKYAAIHQFGGAAGRGHKTILPARPFIAIDSKTKERIVSFIEKFKGN